MAGRCLALASLVFLKKSSTLEKENANGQKQQNYPADHSQVRQ